MIPARVFGEGNGHAQPVDIMTRSCQLYRQGGLPPRGAPYPVLPGLLFQKCNEAAAGLSYIFIEQSRTSFKLRIGRRRDQAQYESGRLQVGRRPDNYLSRGSHRRTPQHQYSGTGIVPVGGLPVFPNMPQFLAQAVKTKAIC